MLTADDVAARLQRSRAWVYRHKDALSGYQPGKGCALSFPEAVIKRIEEGNHALPDERRQMESRQDDRRPKEDKNLQNQIGSKKVGSRARRRDLEARDIHGLLA